MDLDICNTVTLKGDDYSVIVQVSEGTLSVDVELSSSTEQWHGMFDKNYIEELTRKTGNFKQFNVFCNMLETALMRTSDAVSLDLLTIADLEALRQKRSADVRFQATAMRVLTPQNGLSQNGVAQSNGAQQKRYLILTYTAQFDRIHYPLPLTYTGRPNPRRLQQEIRSLKNELRRSRAKSTSLPGDARATSSMIGSAQQESRSAHFELDRLRDDKAALEREINELRLRKLHSEFSVHEPEKETHGVTSSPRGAEDAQLDGETYSARSSGQRQRSAIEFTRMLVAKNEELRREIRLLKGVVQNVEAERIREKSDFQKALGKRQREFRELTEQLEVLRTSERSLRIKLKQTTNELEAFKRIYRAGSSRSYVAHGASDRDSSHERTTFERRPSAGGCPPRSRSVSAERSAVKPPKRPESAREVRKRDRLERALLESLPKSAREFFGDGPVAALRDPPLNAAKNRSRSNSASSATRGVIVPAPKRASSPALIAPKSGASHSLPGSRRTTPRSSVEREPLVSKPRPQSRSNSRERERGGRIKSPSPVPRISKRDSTSPFLYRPIEQNGRSTKTKIAEPKRKVRNDDDNEFKLTLDKHAEAEADRDLEEIDARLQRIQNMMKHYRVPAR